jgi:3-phenylpropionate/trans-cinnamate dioxygenase ferredoxin subunit
MADASVSRPPRPEAVVVGRPADVPEGGSIVVTVGRREIGIFRVDGQFYGLLNRCPHLGGPLCAGQIVTDVVSPIPGDVRSRPGRTFVTCPWHNWEFDIRTGQSYWNERLRAMPFPVAVAGKDAVAGLERAESSKRAVGPYQAETVPVSVEDDFLVLRLRPAQPVAADTSATGERP